MNLPDILTAKELYDHLHSWAEHFGWDARVEFFDPNVGQGYWASSTGLHCNGLMKQPDIIIALIPREKEAKHEDHI